MRLAGHAANHAKVLVCELRGGRGAQEATDESQAGESRGRLLKDPSAEGCLQPISPIAIFLSAAEIMYLLHPAYRRLLPMVSKAVCARILLLLQSYLPGSAKPSHKGLPLPRQQAKRLLPAAFTFAVPSTCHALPPPEGTHRDYLTTSFFQEMLKQHLQELFPLSETLPSFLM